MAYWENLTNPWFIEQVLPGVNLREVFARQDPEEVQRRRRELPWEGKRPSVRIAPRGREGALREALAILKGQGDISTGLGAWAAAQGLGPTPAV